MVACGYGQPVPRIQICITQISNEHWGESNSVDIEARIFSLVSISCMKYYLIRVPNAWLLMLGSFFFILISSLGWPSLRHSDLLLSVLVFLLLVLLFNLMCFEPFVQFGVRAFFSSILLFGATYVSYHLKVGIFPLSWLCHLVFG